MSKTKKTVSLVLGSGGARGLAHIGVIEWLLENGYDIKSISGSSIGALIGGIYATGKLDVYKKWVMALDKTDVFRLLDFSFGSGGLLKGERIMETLRELVGDRLIEDLPISYTAVATDVEKSKEVWLNEGSLFDAIRASIAVPLIFTPYTLNGRKLLDGGLLNPLPIAPTMRDQTDITIAVNTEGLADNPKAVTLDQPAMETDDEQDEDGDSYKARIKEFISSIQGKFKSEREERWDFFDVLFLSLDTMKNAIISTKMATYPPDHLLVISSHAAKAYEFYRAAELIELGRRAADQYLPKE
ncbi:MAG: patatin-like phospholipase family protein [Gammaproteobacteria bacterium]|nr:MAG: patatin-like phospholipase family protein [Gammaproteobacteria bacterium]